MEDAVVYTSDDFDGIDSVSEKQQAIMVCVGELSTRSIQNEEQKIAQS